MLVLMAQFGAGDHPGQTNLLVPLFVLVSAAVGGRLLLAMLGRLIPATRRALRAAIRGHRRLRAEAYVEPRTRAMMDELCPYGWEARITLLRDKVALDWTAFEHEGAHTGVSRRVWARTVNEALHAMVADRRTDETLQEIEHRALADGAVWPDG